MNESVKIRMAHTRFGIEALEVQQKIARESTNARMRRLTCERTAFRDRQSAELALSSRPSEPLSLTAVNALVKRNQSRSVAGKAGALADLTHGFCAAVQRANGGLLASAEAMAPSRDHATSCSDIILPPEDDVLSGVQARLRTLRRQRKEAERQLEELRCC
jgi:hypothetical protein